MTEIKKSKDGIEYLIKVLVEKSKVITRGTFWKIPHSDGSSEIHLKLGRYKKTKGPLDLDFESLESLEPKSELTLNGEEFLALVNFIRENYEPFKRGVKNYIPIDEGKIDLKNLEHLKTLFEHPEKEKLLEFITSNEIIPDDLIASLDHAQRLKEVETFEEMAENDLSEHKWQEWFQKNSWVLGSEFVRILDEREIDISNISDFLMEAYDGFLDIVEIKRPEGNLKFWATNKDHGNYIPSGDLVKAITQASRYIYEVEREADSIKFLEKVGYVKTIKPRCVLIFGRSFNWNNEQEEAYRLLNSNYHNLTIMTYDHILDRAKRMLGIKIS